MASTGGVEVHLSLGYIQHYSAVICIGHIMHHLVFADICAQAKIHAYACAHVLTVLDNLRVLIIAS